MGNPLVPMALLSECDSGRHMFVTRFHMEIAMGMGVTITATVGKEITC
jgi:hypothetical protein